MCIRDSWRQGNFSMILARHKAIIEETEQLGNALMKGLTTIGWTEEKYFS